MGRAVVDERRPCPICGSARWTLLDGESVLMALEGGLDAIAYAYECGFMRWHRTGNAPPEHRPRA